MAEKHEQLDRAVRDFIWNIVEVHIQLEEIHKSWARLLGISEPQWLILMAIDELDEGRGVSGIAVANKLRIHPAFVTNQTKKLETMEYLARAPSPDDARFLEMSLTQKARAEIAKLSIKREALNSTMFEGLDEASIHYLNKRLVSIARNSRLASQKLSIGVL
ncbi:MarR family transcriptional regulator [Bradyrhizobium sp. 24]|uniref:MarR family winged helix-turn-helix transcriptional regulator n=1 Tax=unclassified Bradyrhizobium TaxID=2631580 RepID=UPI001FFB96E3|nr:MULTISPECIES: MarR family transcriptional regulator [unclassified Bradyrhizobium]MCK1299717.1 MarR family transcriptional regulator [Bradyrhizobium sp. 37]MCK1382402.1 MarR family transcriptional regulator [Bradyrhizobium sp. 24]MCK1771467.1 MarR family transcriptional regulator [Bradyrhizobium sp. 134]